jgi:hypothetical protein
MTRRPRRPDRTFPSIDQFSLPSALFIALLVIAAVLVGRFDRGGAAMVDDGTPGGIPVGTPVDCGRPVTSWGSAVASDVRIQLRAVNDDVPFNDTPSPTPPGGLTVVDLEIANLGADSVRIDPADVTIHTCAGEEVHPSESQAASAIGLGTIAPGESRGGTLSFALAPDDQALLIVIEIEEEARTGARVECDLVVDDNNKEPGEIAVGCSAFGGNAQPGADAVGDDATAPADGSG